MKALIPKGRWLLLEFIFYISGCLAFLFMILREWWIMGACIAICIVVAAVNLRADRKTRTEEAKGSES